MGWSYLNPQQRGIVGSSVTVWLVVREAVHLAQTPPSASSPSRGTKHAPISGWVCMPAHMRRRGPVSWFSDDCFASLAR